MDRFEEWDIKRFNNLVKIYIPVWIDLKKKRDETNLKFKKIYIPVWIDLKLSLNRFLTLLSVYLHSSMDRFEAYLSVLEII